MHCSLLKNWITFRGRGWEQHSSRDYKGNSGELLDSCAWNYTGLITTTWAQTGCSAYQLIKHIQDKTPLTVLASLEHLPKNHDKASPQECRFNKNLCPLSSTKWTVCSLQAQASIDCEITASQLSSTKDLNEATKTAERPKHTICQQVTKYQ